MGISLMLRARRDADDQKDRNDDDGNQKRAKLPQINPFPKLQPNLRCPRCFSPNTKFCYFNNHNLGQPRYLCRACRRYWTQGGALRNVPVGGGIRRRRRVFLPSAPNPVNIQLTRTQPPTLPEPSRQVVSGGSGLSSLSRISLIDRETVNRIGIFDIFEEMQNRSRNGGGGNQTNPPLPIGGGANSPISSGIRSSTIEYLLPQTEAEAPPQGPAQPPLQIHDQGPAAPPQIGLGGEGGDRSEDKQPMYPPDQTVDLPVGTCMNAPWTGAENNNGASTSNSNLWNNSNGASTSTGLTESSSFNPNGWLLDEWLLDDDYLDLQNLCLGDSE